jgi:N-glycosylase/DNA lyase
MPRGHRGDGVTLEKPAGASLALRGERSVFLRRVPVQTPQGFDLALVVRSHGWYDLTPWRWDEDARELSRPLRLSPKTIVVVRVAQKEAGALLAFTGDGLDRDRQAALEARERLATCRSLEDDLTEFRSLAKALEQRRVAGQRNLPDLRWALARGAGRLLRSPTVFEDAVKTLCTTNCTWALTRVMVRNLCALIGEEAPDGSHAFPGPEAMAAKPELFFKEKIRAGYRAPFLRNLSRAVASGHLDLEAFRSSSVPTEELAERILALDGFGPYATQRLLKLLGRFDHLALDSFSRAKLKELRGRRRTPTDGAIRSWYRPYGRFAGIAMWLEVTADWHRDGIPGWPKDRN